AERGTHVPASTCLRVRERVYHQTAPMSISTIPAPPNPRAMNTPAILLSSEDTKPPISWCGATITVAQAASEDAVNGGALTVYSPAAPVRKVRMLEAATSLTVVFESGPGTGVTSAPPAAVTRTWSSSSASTGEAGRARYTAYTLSASRATVTSPGTSVPPTASSPGPPSADNTPVGTTEKKTLATITATTTAAIRRTAPTTVSVIGPFREVLGTAVVVIASSSQPQRRRRAHPMVTRQALPDLLPFHHMDF